MTVFYCATQRLLVPAKVHPHANASLQAILKTGRHEAGGQDEMFTYIGVDYCVCPPAWSRSFLSIISVSCFSSLHINNSR